MVVVISAVLLVHALKKKIKVKMKKEEILLGQREN